MSRRVAHGEGLTGPDRGHIAAWRPDGVEDEAWYPIEGMRRAGVPVIVRLSSASSLTSSPTPQPAHEYAHLSRFFARAAMLRAQLRA